MSTIQESTFKEKFGPRGVLKCVATETETVVDDPRFGKWGKQKCEDTGTDHEEAHGDHRRGNHRGST